MSDSYQGYYDYLCEWPWFTIFAYTGAIVAFLAAFYLEYKDLFCPYGGIAKVGKGNAYNKGKVHEDDDCDDILQKIRISSRYDEASVYWRRTIIFTVLLLFAVLILTQQRLPTAYEIVVGFTVIYMFTYLFLTYYQTVVSIPATSQVTTATKILKKKCLRDSSCYF